MTFCIQLDANKGAVKQLAQTRRIEIYLTLKDMGGG